MLRKRECTSNPRNALRGRCGWHEVIGERTQLVPHPLKSGGVQENDRLVTARDDVRDVVRDRRDRLQCQHETVVYLLIE